MLEEIWAARPMDAVNFDHFALYFSLLKYGKLDFFKMFQKHLVSPDGFLCTIESTS